MHNSGWNLTRVDEVLERVTRPVTVEQNAIYQEVGIRSHGKGIFHKPVINGKDLGDKRVFWVVPNALMFNIVFAWEQAVAVTSKQEIGMIASHRFPMYLPKENRCNVEYLRQFFCTARGKKLLELASPGGAGRNKTLGQKEFEKLKIFMPSVQEQRKVSAILETWDMSILVIEKLLCKCREQKRSLAKRLLQPARKEDWKKNGWRRVSLSEIVKIDSQSLSTKTPANFSFRYISLSDISNGKISSQLPNYIFKDAPSRARRVVQLGDIIFSTVRPTLMGHAIIEEDHASCVVSTGFSVLTPKNVDRNYLYQCLFSEDLKKQLDVLVVGSSFPAISSAEVEDLQISLPRPSEQIRIGKLLTTADRQISRLAESIELLKKQKLALLAQVLTGKRRVRTHDVQAEQA